MVQPLLRLVGDWASPTGRIAWENQSNDRPAIVTALNESCRVVVLSELRNDC